jgi:hypothetical protein
MKWSYYCVQPDESTQRIHDDSIRVYIYNQDNVCYYRVFEKTTFANNLKSKLNENENLGEVGFTYENFCIKMKSDDLQFEVLKQSENMLASAFHV